MSNDTTSRLLVRIVSFASALIEYKYGSYGCSSDDYYLAPLCGPRVITDYFKVLQTLLQLLSTNLDGF